MTRGCVTSQKRDIDGNFKGTTNNNPILDTCEYIMTFDDGDLTDLTANLIAKSLYAQCDPDENQYVLLDPIIDYRRLDLMIAALNDTQVRTGDVPNAYITAPCKEQVRTVLGPKFGPKAGKVPSLCASYTDLIGGCSVLCPPCIIHALNELHLLQV